MKFSEIWLNNSIITFKKIVLMAKMLKMFINIVKFTLYTILTFELAYMSLQFYSYFILSQILKVPLLFFLSWSDYHFNPWYLLAFKERTYCSLPILKVKISWFILLRTKSFTFIKQLIHNMEWNMIITSRKKIKKEVFKIWKSKLTLACKWLLTHSWTLFPW